MIDETPLLTEEQARWLFMLRRIQLDCGYRPAWIAHAMQDRFGTWIEFSPDALGTGIAPHADVLAFVEAKLEHFKAERAAERENALPPPPWGPRTHFLRNGAPACGTTLPERTRRCTTEDHPRVTCESCRRTPAWRNEAHPSVHSAPQPASRSQLRLAWTNPAHLLEESGTWH